MVFRKFEKVTSERSASGGGAKRSPLNDQVRKGVQESSCWESCTCATLTPPKRPEKVSRSDPVLPKGERGRGRNRRAGGIVFLLVTGIWIVTHLIVSHHLILNSFERAPASHYHRTRNTHGRYGRIARSTNLPAVYMVGTPQPANPCALRNGQLRAHRTCVSLTEHV